MSQEAASQSSNNSQEQEIWDDQNTFFGIDTATGSEQFFNEGDDDPAPGVETTIVPKPKPKDGEETPEEEVEEFPGDKERKALQEKEEKFFEEDDDEEGAEGDEEKGDEEDNEEGATSTDLNTIFTALQENGAFAGIELAEGETLDIEKLVEHYNNDVENRIDESVRDMFGEDKEFQAWYKHKQAGGTTAEFLDTYFSQDLPELDMTNVAHQEQAVREYISSVLDEDDDETIETQVQALKDSGRLAKTAEKYYNKMQEQAEKQKAEVERVAAERLKKSKENIVKFETEVVDTLTNTETVGDFSFKKVDKKALANYITKATVKVAPNRFQTPLQHKLTEVFGNKEKLIVLAKILQSDFNVDDVIIKKNTKEVANAKDKAGKKIVPKKVTLNKRDPVNFF